MTEQYSEMAHLCSSCRNNDMGLRQFYKYVWWVVAARASFHAAVLSKIV